MSAEKNPFAVLGFAPSAFENLSESEIRDLVKAQHRALIMIHHPDRLGSAKRFKEVTEAMGKLNEDFEFDFWIKNFLKPKKNQLAELEKAKRKADEVSKFFHRALVDFWLGFCRGRNVMDWSSSLGKSAEELREYPGFSVFDPPSASCLMLERVVYSTRKLVEQAHGKSELSRLPDGSGVPKNFDGSVRKIDDGFELRILPGGKMERQLLVKTKFDIHEVWRPPVRKEWISFDSKRSYYWKPEGPVTAVPGKLLGSISKEAIENIKGLHEESPALAALGTEADLDALTVAPSGYTAVQFEPFLRFIRPWIKPYDHLVVVENLNDEMLRFKLLGHPIKILPIEA